MEPIVGLEGLVPSGSAAEVMATGSVWAEGVVYIPATDTVRWSDIPTNRIVQHVLATDTTSVYREDAQFTNGRTMDHDGSVIQC